jgi:hypothetical protein
MPLLLHKTTHSVDPWHISVEAPYVARYGPLTGGRLVVATCRFRTHREALPVFRALQALPVPWEQPIETWTVLQRDLVSVVLADRLAREQAAQAARLAQITRGR